jgi:hypothetical protein
VNQYRNVQLGTLLPNRIKARIVGGHASPLAVFHFEAMFFENLQSLRAVLYILL